MLEAMQVYSPADSRRTPYVGRNHGDDGDDDFDDAANTYDAAADKYIMIQCLFVTFLFIPALLPSPVQSCYDWIKRKVESRK